MESRLDVYEDRLLSFTNWPQGLYLKPAVMAAAGLIAPSVILLRPQQ